MTQIDLDKLQAANFMPGLTVLGDPLTFSKPFTGSIPILSSINTTLPLPFSRQDAISLIEVNIAGGHMGALWFPVAGFAGIEDALSVSPFSSAYYMLFTVTAAASGRNLNIEFINETVGAVVNLPSLTITAKVHLYTYPF